MKKNILNIYIYIYTYIYTHTHTHIYIYNRSSIVTNLKKTLKMVHVKKERKKAEVRNRRNSIKEEKPGDYAWVRVCL